MKTLPFAVGLASVWMAGIGILRPLDAAEVNPPAPAIVLGQSNGQMRLIFPYPGTARYEVFSAEQAPGPYASDPTGLLGPTFTTPTAGPSRFFRAAVTPLSSNDLLAATVLNRLTYGPTPDDIERIEAIGPQAFIDEQLAAEAFTETIDFDPPVTNSLPPAPPLTNWIRVSATGTATSGTNFFVYLSGPGSVYVDDVRLALGTNADVGTNLLVNGDFEDPTLTNGWTVASIYQTSSITNSPTLDGLAASGTNCLLLVGTGNGSGSGSSLQQPFSLTNYPASQRFTLSFSYLPVRQSVTNVISLTVRLSGSVTIATVPLPSVPVAPPVAPPGITPVYGKLTNTTATISDLRAWHVFHAIHGKRQLHEVLAQFFQNHFTTQYQKTRDYFDNNFNVGVYTNDLIRENLAVDLHWREHHLFRQALLNPNCTFYDLLKISIESPAMIIYLDTVLNSRAAPNQNYAREILELHSMGADNGYIQQDIVDLSKVWTGWRVDKKDAAVADNVFAAPIPRADRTNFANTPGLWVLHYSTNVHDLSTKRLFTNGPIAARFGAEFGAGQSYALILSNTLATSTNGFGEGYRVIQHLANLPYTKEFISVKLCQLFVHEGFEYGAYDYSAVNPAPEVRLVKQCMTAWGQPGPDGRTGNIRSVLKVIFDSDLFRGHGASRQKIKTPLEFTVSAVRALRITQTDTNAWASSTADSDGYGISGSGSNTSPLSRMGGMSLFNKVEPDGYSELGRLWLNTANLCERMRFAQHLLMPSNSNTKDDDYSTPGLKNTSDPVGLLKSKLPAASWNDAGAVADLFLGLLFPGEGAGNLGWDRAAAIDHLNTGELGEPSPFNTLGDTPAAYDGRVRSMVGLLMSLPRFQEQ